jgi:predicted transcriptional regulator
MKKYSLFLTAFFLITIGSSFQRISAQDKTKVEAEKEAKIQQSIEQQKKALAEQKRSQAYMDQKMKKKSAEYEIISDSLENELENVSEDRARIIMDMPRGNRS